MGRQRLGRGFVQPEATGPTRITRDEYTDECRFKRELDRIFGRTWLRAFRAEEVQSPRSYRVWERFGQTVVVTRGDRGDLSAFHNVCQHRGARIVRGEGVCGTARFVCPWHGFTYGLDGTVVKVPRREAFPPDLIDGLRAPRVAVEEWSGWIWLNLAGDDVDPLRDYLGEIQEDVDWYGMDTWKVWGHQTWDIPANWKVVQEGFLEAWHVPFSHKKSLPGARSDQNVTFHELGDHNMMVMPGGRVDPETIDPSVDYQAISVPHYLVFPNALWNCGRVAVQAQIAWPVSVDRTLFEVWGLAPARQPDGSRSQQQWVELMEKVWLNTEKVIGEDVVLATEAGATRDSLGYVASRLNDQEHRISAFHATLDRYLDDEAGR